MRPPVVEIAARHTVRVLDLSIVGRLTAAEYLASDGFHPSIAGQRAIYDAIAMELAQEPLFAGA